MKLEINSHPMGYENIMPKNRRIALLGPTPADEVEVEYFRRPPPKSTEAKRLASKWQREWRIPTQLARAWRTQDLFARNSSEKKMFKRDKAIRKAVLKTWEDNPGGSDLFDLEAMIKIQLSQEYGETRLRPMTEREKHQATITGQNLRKLRKGEKVPTSKVSVSLKPRSPKQLERQFKM